VILLGLPAGRSALAVPGDARSTGRRASALPRGVSLSPRELVRRCLVFSRWATCLSAGLVLALATDRLDHGGAEAFRSGIIPYSRLVATVDGRLTHVDR
jgi:hypothetical protein